MLLGPGEQAAADPAALVRGPYSQVLHQQVAGLGDQDDETADLPVPLGDPGLPAAHGLVVVGGHRGRRPADPGYVGLIGRGRDGAEQVSITLVSQPDGHIRRHRAGHSGGTWQVTAHTVALISNGAAGSWRRHCSRSAARWSGVREAT